MSVVAASRGYLAAVQNLQAEYKQYELELTRIFSPEGYGIEFEVFPWLMYLPSQNMSRLKRVREMYRNISKALMEGRKVCILHKKAISVL